MAIAWYIYMCGTWLWGEDVEVQSRCSSATGCSTTGTPRAASSSLGRTAGPCWDSWCPRWIKVTSPKCNSGHTTVQTQLILHFPKADFSLADHSNLSCHLPAAVHKQNWSAKYSHWENREICKCKRKKQKPNWLQYFLSVPAIQSTTLVFHRIQLPSLHKQNTYDF